MIKSALCLLLLSVILTTHQDVANGALQAIVIGDWGVDTADQIAIAQSMSRWCSPSHRGPCQFILNTGDNFYPDGVDSPDHPRFNTTWRWMYDLPNIDQLVWYNSLGNHDYGLIQDPEFNQVTYGETHPLWYLPWLWYDFFKTDEESGAVVHFIIADSCSIIFRKHDPDRQLAWIEEVLSNSPADWKIFITHYPAYSTGNYAPGTVTIREQLIPLFEKYGVDILLTGHDHNMQHMTTANGVTDYVISGGGGRRLYEYSAAGERVLNSWNVTVEYFGYHFGFLDMQFTKTTMDVDVVDANAEVRYSFSRTK